MRLHSCGHNGGEKMIFAIVLLALWNCYLSWAVWQHTETFGSVVKWMKYVNEILGEKK